MNRKALIVWGGWSGHEPEACARNCAGLLEAEDFDVTVSNDIADLGGTDIASYDLVMPHITDETIEQETVTALTNAVRTGTGLAGFHGGMATSFRSSVAFHFLCGVQWVAHPGNIVDFRVDVAKPDDPIMQGIPDFDYHSEQYYLHYDPSIEILASTTFNGAHDRAVKGITMPVVFKRRFEQGRIFYSALGHVAAELDHPHAREILRRGLLWAARQE